MDHGPFFGPLMEDYFAECDEHLANLRRSLLELEEDPGGPGAYRDERLRGVFRSLHTLKGLAGMVGYAEAEQLAHAMEEWLRAAAPGGSLRSAISLDLVFEGTTLLERCLVAQRDGSPAPDVEEFARKLELAPPVALPEERDTGSRPAAAGGSPAGVKLSPAETLRLEEALARGDRLDMFEFIPTPELVERGIGVEVIRSRLASIAEILNATPRVLPGRGVAFHFLVARPGQSEVPEEWRRDGLEWSPFSAVPEGDVGAQSPPDGEDQSGARTAEPQKRGTTIAASNVVRVDLGRLDELMRLVGELVISRSRLDELVTHAGRHRESPSLEVLEEISSALERQLRDLREGVMRVRLVPIGEVFERMRFVVREAANEAQKDVRIEFQGQGTEIDKLVVERMMEPLLHLVRNAVSHGIETPSLRTRLGKPAEGRLVLRAAAAGERVRIEVEDDGQGIDREAVASRARSRGMAVADEALDDAAILDLICAPGFSTREVADLASGRGVGMDVVRSTVQALGGQLLLRTEAGRGTRFVVELPLTLMIVDALLVRIADQVMAVPQPALLEVIQVGPGEVVCFEQNEVVRYRDRVLPLLRLRTLFRLGRQGERDTFPVLVVGADTQPIGLAVDRIVGVREIVVRSLSDPLVAVPGIGGATELGDGRVCLILDSAELVQLAHRQRGQIRVGHSVAAS